MLRVLYTVNYMMRIRLFFRILGTAVTRLFKHSRRWYFLVGRALLLSGTLTLIAYQNIHAELSLQSARHSDDKGQLSSAKSTLHSISHFLVLPGITNDLNKEQTRNQQLISKHTETTDGSTAQTETSGSSSKTSPTPQKPGTQQPTGKPGTTQTGSPTGKTGGTGSSSGGTTSGSTSGGTPGSSGGGGATPPPPGPMSQISASLSITASAYSATECSISQTVNFSVDGSGSVSVTWKVLSNRTSSAIDNPVSYSFSTAGSKSDHIVNTWQGLESGDSYRISAIVTDTANASVTTTAGPYTVSSCAAPQALMTGSGTSYMTHIAPGTLSGSQYQDSIFSNECSMTFQEPFSVDGAGSVQAVYVITSGSSGGQTLYSNTRQDFSGAGSTTDTSYTRMPHLNSGDIYTINVTLYDLANHSIIGTAGPITSGCS